MSSAEPAASAEAAAAGFRDTYGCEPAGVWSAPGRINLIGEHTDYNDGLVLPIAIGQRTWVAAGPRADRIARVSSSLADGPVEQSIDAIGADTVAGWSAYPFGTAWGILDTLGRPDAGAGFDAYFDSDVPLGAGLSSSAALACALVTALPDLWQLELDPEQRLRATHVAENEIVGAPTGILDQSASLFCQEGRALLIDCRTGEREQVPFDLPSSRLELLVVDTRVAHAHADGGYADRRRACESAAAALGVTALRDVDAADLDRLGARLGAVELRRARHVVTENERVRETVRVLREQGPEAIGELMLASHASMRDDFEITVPELDLAVQAAAEAGALGARMTGGGFGGSAIVLVGRDSASDVAEQITAAFADRGFAAPHVFSATVSAGARRDRP